MKFDRSSLKDSSHPDLAFKKKKIKFEEVECFNKNYTTWAKSSSKLSLNYLISRKKKFKRPKKIIGKIRKSMLSLTKLCNTNR
jgi:hypothetical protein